MSKSQRIEKRINRIEDRFKKKVAKGKKGTDMDIELHERKIQALRDKSPLNFGMLPNMMSGLTPSFGSMGQVGVGGGIMPMMQNPAQWVANQSNSYQNSRLPFWMRPSSVGAGPGIGASGTDPNNTSAVGNFSTNPNAFSGDPFIGGENMGSVEQATGNAPNNTTPANVATQSNFNPTTEEAAMSIFGNGTQVQNRKKLITL